MSPHLNVSRPEPSTLARWSALIFVSLVMFSSYYFYDVFSAIKATLQAETGMSNAEYGTMYGAYSFTNSFLLMAFFGGILLDRWGFRKSSALFFSFMFIGTFLTAYGATDTFQNGGPGYGLFSSFLPSASPALKMMIFGRVLFGLGAETFYMGINKIIAKWFKSKELALAFAINVAFGRFGTAAALSFSPRLAGMPPQIEPAAWFGFMIMLIGLFTTIAYLFMDASHERKYVDISGEEADHYSLNDVKLLLTNRSFLYITTLCVLFYSAVFPFLGYAPDFLHNKFGFSLEASGDLTTILPYGTIVFTPIFGWFCDNRGKSASLMVWGSVILIFVFLVMALTPMLPYVPLFFLGISFSLVPAAMWPAVAKIVNEKRLGTAYGFMFTVQNFGLMLFPFFIGKILDISNQNIPEGAPLNYTWAVLMLTILGALGLIFAFLLKRDDKKMNYGLERPNRIPA